MSKSRPWNSLGVGGYPNSSIRFSLGNLAQLAREERLRELSGIGEYLAKKIQEYLWIGGREESGIYRAVGLPWIAPELREDQGELDILSDGSMDYPNRVLAELDFVIGAIHSGFTQSERILTQRLIQAMRNPGLGVARRAWLEPRHLLNGMNRNQLFRWIAHKRKRLGNRPC